MARSLRRGRSSQFVVAVTFAVLAAVVMIGSIVRSLWLFPL